MTIRQKVAAAIDADWTDIKDLAAVWVIASQKEAKIDTRVTAVFSQQTVVRTPKAPIGSRTVGMTLELVSPHKDADAAADQLEEVLLAVLDYLGPIFGHGTATFIPYGERFAYSIPFTVIAAVTETQE